MNALMKGWRTLSAVLAFLATGLLSVFGAVDLTPVIALFVQDPALLGAAMVGVGILFGVLRAFTNSPIFYQNPHRGADVDEAPEYLRPGIGEGM